MKTLIVPFEIDHRGGGERVVYKAGTVLAEEGSELDLLTNAFETEREEVLETLYDTFGKNEDFDRKINEIYTIEKPSVKKFLKLKYKEAYQLKKARELHKKNEYDAIVLHYSNIHFTPRFEGAKVFYFLGPGPVASLGHIKDIVLSAYMTPYWIFNRLASLRSKPGNYRFISVSRFSRELFRQRFPDIEFDLIYPPVDFENFRYEGEDKRNTIVNFSRITPGKNNQKMVQLASRFKERNDWQFKIVGSLREEDPHDSRYYEQLKEHARSLDNLEILTNVPFEELTEALKKAKLNVHLAENDTMPSTPIESMAAGCNQIVHKSGGPWIDVVRKGEYGDGWIELDELEEKVRENMGADPDIERNIDRAEDFGEAKFRQDFRQLANELMSHQKRGAEV